MKALGSPEFLSSKLSGTSAQFLLTHALKHDHAEGDSDAGVDDGHYLPQVGGGRRVAIPMKAGVHPLSVATALCSLSTQGTIKIYLPTLSVPT